MPNGAKRDELATVLARRSGKLKDYRSFIATDGREFLFGSDKTTRRREIYERDAHRCQNCGDLVSWDDMHWDHEASRSARGYRPGGDDSLENGVTFCERCHIQSPISKHA